MRHAIATIGFAVGLARRGIATIGTAIDLVRRTIDTISPKSCLVCGCHHLITCTKQF